MTEAQSAATLAIFAAVILAIALDWLETVVAGLVGVSALLALGILEGRDVLAAFEGCGGALALLFGGMIVARVLASTGLFERLGDLFLRATGGSGRRYLLGVVAVVAPLCAFLPNATTMLLVAPILIRSARALGVDFVGPLVLAAIVSNTAGLLTLVGDPATFLVGSAIGMSFGEYLRRVCLGGLAALLVLVPTLPLLFRETWRLRRELPPDRPLAPIARPAFAALAIAVLGAMLVLFVFGDRLPSHIVPPGVAVIAASLALLVVYSFRVESVESVLRDVDWRTLLFIACMFCMVQALTRTGLVEGGALALHARFGAALVPVALLLLAGVGLLSGLLANIPVVAAALLLAKGYLVTAEVVPEAALGRAFAAWPDSTLPVFVAMMFGATLGGNATLIGASANLVAAGICAREGEPLRFGRFLRYGAPLTLLQLAVAALYVLVLFRIG
ncbi:MAG TPA: SLC13 family permease [Myxococcota bacterium]|nr:SLC13 family permease [Myxococcota bacterium]